MFDPEQIRENMEVVSDSGMHIGTIDAVQSDRIKLTRSDSKDGLHHYLPLSAIDRIEDNRVYLQADTEIPVGVR